MFINIYKRAFEILMKKPLKLWGISLLNILLISVLTALCGATIPGLGIAVSLLLSTSMTMVYLYGYRGEDVQVTQLFSCFKDWQTIKRVTLGMGWMVLWIFLWALIPVVGIVFAVIRAYEYRLTPYILVTEPDVSITDAIKVSKERTNGYKLQMWLADFLIFVAFFVVTLVLGLLMLIPFIGLLFGLANFILSVLFAVFCPLFIGLVQAAFYEEINRSDRFCGNCGAPKQNNSYFCNMCGQPTAPNAYTPQPAPVTQVPQADVQAQQ